MTKFQTGDLMVCMEGSSLSRTSVGNLYVALEDSRATSNSSGIMRESVAFIDNAGEVSRQRVANFMKVELKGKQIPKVLDAVSGMANRGWSIDPSAME